MAKHDLKDLTYNEKYEFYEGTIFFMGIQINVTINATNDKKIPEFTNKILEYIESNISKIKEFATKQLINTYNNFWNEDEEEISENDMIEVLSLEAITINKEGSFVVDFESDDLFLEHVISVEISKDFKMEEANLVG